MRREQRPLTQRELERVTSARPVLRRVKEVRAADNTCRTDCPGAETRVAGRMKAEGETWEEESLERDDEVGRSSKGSQGRRR